MSRLKILGQSLFFVGLLVAAFMVPVKVHAVPASPDVHVMEQPDGTRFNAVQWGDENRHGWETEDGYTVVFEEKMNRWTYARQGFDGSLVGTAYIAGKDAPPSDMKKRVRPLVPKDQPVMKKMTTKERSFAAPGRTTGEVVVPLRAPGPQLVVPSTGTANVPVILINFSDRTATYTPSQFNSLIFGTGNKSMKDYYQEVSYNGFSVSPGPSSLAQWYQASHTHNYYGTNEFYNALLVRETAQIADTAGFDFNAYDTDDDCKVDVFAVIHQGPGQEATGNSYDIWSHRWSLDDAASWCASYTCGLTLGAYTTNSVCSANPAQHVVVDDYIIMPEKYGTGMTTMGVFAHEYGHSLGLPDLYDTDYTSEGAGKWSIMAAGSWNMVTRAGDRPAHMDAWSKYALGWVVPTVVTTPLANEPITAAEGAPDVYKLLAGTPTSGEFFLVENRQKTSFDAGLPGAGLLIWHIDGNYISTHIGTNDVNDNECYPPYVLCNSSAHYGVALAQADNRFDLEYGSYYGGDRGDAGDPFPGSAVKRFFSASSDPYNNSNLYSGALSNVIVTDISNSGATMTASMTAEPLLPVTLVEAVDNPSLTFTLGGTGSWTGQELISFSGGDAAQSPLLGHSVFSSMQTEVAGPASISFHWKVSSQATYDYVNFTVDGVQKARISGEVKWQQKWYTLAASAQPHKLKWTYVKNGSVSKGMDAAWVDKVEVNEFPKVVVNSPNNTWVIQAGYPQTIDWDAPAAAAKYKLYYSLDNGYTWKLIASDVTGNTYPWTPPAVNANKNACKVKVAAYTSAGALVGTGISGVFKIFTVNVSSPNGGETLTGGAGNYFFNIGSTVSPISTLWSYYTLNGGLTWTLIEKLTTSDTTFTTGPWMRNWTIPTVTAAKTKCRIKVTIKNAAGTVIGTDMSNGYFTINP